MPVSKGGGNDVHHTSQSASCFQAVQSLKQRDFLKETCKNRCSKLLSIGKIQLLDILQDSVSVVGTA